MQNQSAIVSHPKYNKIIALYRELYIANGGQVNEKQFFTEHIAPIAPNYNLANWYHHIKTYKKRAGIVASLAVKNVQAAPVATEQGKLETALMSNDAATQLGIQSALTIGARTLSDILNNPERLAAIPAKDRTDFLFKAMKAQDSRIKAIGAMKQDNREEAKFNNAFKGAM